MTVNTDSIRTFIRELETFLLHDNIFKESDAHPLLILRNQLQEMDDQLQLIAIDTQRKLVSDLYCLEMKYCFYLIQQYSALIPLSLIKALLDTIRFQINMNMNLHPSLTDHYFHLSLIYLTTDSTINYLNNKKEVSTNFDELFLRFFSSIGSRAVYIKTNISYSICVSYKNIPEFFQLNSSTESLLQAILIYLNNYFFNNHQQYECHTSILQWLLTLTNIYGFVPYFVKTDYPNSVLQWLKMKPDQAKHISLPCWFLILNLLHNIARHRMGVKTLNKLKAIPILKQWKDQFISELISLENNETDKDILIAYHLVYAILLEPKELKKEDISNIQIVLDYILERTIQAFQSIDLCFGPYNICEYLNGLTKFVVNDQCLLYIISREKMFDLFMENFLRLNTNYQSTDLNTIICSLLYTIFWSISFQGEYHMKLKSNEQFLPYVEQISKIESIDERIIMMKRAAKGILFNLDLIQMDIQPIEESINDNQMKIMISYAHKDTTFCQKLVKNLQEICQDDIWVDFNKLSAPYEDDWEEIAIAITQCDVILMIVTENYCSSKSCRREAIHADKRNKRMIPIYQGKDYKPDDWFEIRLGSAIWVRFGDKKSDDDVLKTLLELIHAKDKVKRIVNDQNSTHEQQINTSVITEKNLSSIPKSSHVNPVNSSNLTVLTSSIEQWTCEEIQQWLHLPSGILQFSSGQALITYMNLLSYPEAQYDEYKHRMHSHGVSREQFANLIGSFSSIRSTEQNLNAKLAEQWTYDEMKSWFQQNHLSNALFHTLNFTDGSQLLTYAQILIGFSSHTEDEYNRLRNQIGKDLFHLDEYARLLNGLKNLLHPSKSQKNLK